jgi:hypothetical protein
MYVDTDQLIWKIQDKINNSSNKKEIIKLQNQIEMVYLTENILFEHFPKLNERY